VFDEIYKTRSVTAPPASLDLGQPAVSVALSKLRHHFDEPAVCAHVQGMEPTPFGEGLVRPVRGVLEALDQVLGHRNEFDPATVAAHCFASA
jgi:DNA-binding transcriptional LysR family regulator